ncbi:unnamed protein product [Meloidogyne enterolobii]|uniref:Uncharacterized protein n=1 Tax=Meloidogyne enterolobii TaxID=390850 RepID=A0ACB0YF76_MELEN
MLVICFEANSSSSDDRTGSDLSSPSGDRRGSDLSSPSGDNLRLGLRTLGLSTNVSGKSKGEDSNVLLWCCKVAIMN